MTRRIQDTDMCVEGTVEGVKIGGWWTQEQYNDPVIKRIWEDTKISETSIGAVHRKLYQADGGPMKAEGQAAVRIGVGRFSVRHNVVVVDCSDEGILGGGCVDSWWCTDRSSRKDRVPGWDRYSHEAGERWSLSPGEPDQRCSGAGRT